MIKSLSLSLLLAFSGEYKAQIQFDGPLQKTIQGQITDTPELTSDKSCEWSGQFQEVLYRKQRHLKVLFKSVCQIQRAKGLERVETTLHPEYIRLKDLVIDSKNVQISPQHKNVQLRVLDLKL